MKECVLHEPEPCIINSCHLGNIVPSTIAKAIVRGCNVQPRVFDLCNDKSLAMTASRSKAWWTLFAGGSANQRWSFRLELHTSADHSLLKPFLLALIGEHMVASDADTFAYDPQLFSGLFQSNHIDDSLIKLCLGPAVAGLLRFLYPSTRIRKPLNTQSREFSV